MPKQNPLVQPARPLTTPQSQLAMRLLLLSTVELQAHVQQAIEENPLLETNEEFDATWAIDSLAASLPAARVAPAAPAPAGRSCHTLKEHLAWQLELAQLPAGPMVIGCALIEAIDADGYLAGTSASIAEALSGKLRADAGVIEWVLAGIQAFDPPGVGARTEAECIELRLARLGPATPGLEPARALARAHLERVVAGQFEALRREMPCSDEELDAALALVRISRGSPGDAFKAPRTEYVVPEAFARRNAGSWEVELNPATLPGVRMNEAALARITRAREFALQRAQLHEARWLMAALRLRNEMMFHLACTIVGRQPAFLERAQDSMLPMSLREAADPLQVHESAIARATTGKYLQTPRGVFELRSFFSRHAPGEARASAATPQKEKAALM